MTQTIYLEAPSIRAAQNAFARRIGTTTKRVMVSGGDDSMYRLSYQDYEGSVNIVTRSPVQFV